MSALEAIWWRERGSAGAALLLAPLSAIELAFRGAVLARDTLHRAGLLRAARAGVPVISIGNLAVGGAGKTPAALAVAARLLARGRRVAVLSRGYGATRADARVVSDGARVLLGAAEAGDEPALLARRLPGAAVLCGPRRAELARIATGALAADALLLDDGFQHRALFRDLDVVVLDAANPFGNGHLLPRGPNREPAAALGRAGLVWLSRVDQAPAERVAALRDLARRTTGRPPVESRHAPVDLLDGALALRHGLATLRGARVLALSGLARPGGFRRTLEALGAEVALERAFPDHHRFATAELDEAHRAAAEAGCAFVVTTEKDAVRLAPAQAADPRLRVVRIEAEIVAGADALEAALDVVLAAHPTPTQTEPPTPIQTQPEPEPEPRPPRSPRA
jgi:tetraacyldisaccharide 4'-kinase